MSESANKKKKIDRKARESAHMQKLQEEVIKRSNSI